jgi:hypothetical protein
MRRGASIPPKGQSHAKAWEVLRDVFAPVQGGPIVCPVICIQASDDQEPAPILEAMDRDAEGSTSHHLPGLMP